LLFGNAFLLNIQMGKTRRSKEMRGGGDVKIKLTWTANGTPVDNLLAHLKTLAEGDEREALIDEVTDETEVHVDESGYGRAHFKTAKGRPSSLNRMTANHDEDDAPKISPFNYTLKTPKGKLKLSAAFTVKDVASGGQKTRRRR
jgi:hypothetical protein